MDVNKDMLDTIKTSCDHYFEIDISEDKRQFNYVRARLIYYNIARAHTKCSTTQIGSFIKRNHATVLHNLKNFEKDVMEVPEYKEAYFNIFEMCSKIFRESKVNMKHNKDIIIVSLQKKVSHLTTELEFLKSEIERKRKFGDQMENELLDSFRELDYNGKIDAISKIRVMEKVRRKLADQQPTQTKTYHNLLAS